MAFLEKQLLIKKSTLPGSGKGLFTKKFIPKGSRICRYKGRMTTWKEVDHNEGANGYIYYIDRMHVLNALTYIKSAGRYANDAMGISRVKGILNNAEYISEGTEVYIEATKDITAGSEILVAYGKEYWDVIRHNQRITDAKKSA